MEHLLIGAHADREQKFMFPFDESVGPSLLATVAAADAAILERMAS
jgi:hypothetical protein